MKSVVILGSTGSIGTQAERIIRRDPANFKIVGLAARGGNVNTLVRQAIELRPAVVAVFDEARLEEVRERVPGGIKVLTGMEGLLELCTMPNTDTVLNAMVGMVGLRPTLETLSCGKRLLLANKESLVAGGELVMKYVHGDNMIPVDSEHSGIKMCLRGNSLEEVERVTIYASGGPFLGEKRKDLADKTVEQALGHKTWVMGKTITIQSSTLANKGREVMEAMWIYGLRRDQVSVLVESSSTFHASVLFRDGAEMAQIAYPNMEIPIQYALYYPERPKNGTVRPTLGGRSIRFEEPDRETFKSLRLAEEAADIKLTMPAVFNGADEKAVEMFLDKKIKFLDMGDLVEEVMRTHNPMEATLRNILAADFWARKEVERLAWKG